MFGPQVTPILKSPVNSWYSFFIGPDGSKEGWKESDTGDESRRVFKDWLQTKYFSDNSTSLKWVEVQYGDENLDTKIVDDCDAPLRNAMTDPS